MKKITLLLSLITLLSCGGDDEIPLGSPFVKYFGDRTASFELKDMVLSDDGVGVVLLGVREGDVFLTEDESPILKRFYVVLADENGTTIKQGSLPFLDAVGNVIMFDLEASRVTSIEGGGYLVIGTREIESVKVGATKLVKLIVWVQLDNNLEMTGQWMAAGDTINNYYGVDINVTSDGGVLLAGYTDANGDNDFFYRKVGGSTTDWSRTQTRENSDDRLVRVLPIAGGFGLFGRTDGLAEDGKTGINVERTIITEQGVIINSLVYGTSVGAITDFDDIPTDVIEKPGGFAVVGEAIRFNVSRPFLLDVDLAGAIAVAVNYATDFAAIDDGIEGGATSITQSPSNDFVIVGELQDYTENYGAKGAKDRNNEVMVMRTDQAGVPIGSIKNFGVENGEDKGVRVLTTADGRILVGATYDFGGGLIEMVLLKMNADGELKQ